MIGAPDIDQIAKPAIKLVFVIRDVGGEIGIGVVGFQKRPIDVIAIRSGPKQRLLAVFVVVDGRALRRW